MTQCIFDELFGYFAGSPQEKFYQIFTAMMNSVVSGLEAEGFRNLIRVPLYIAFHYHLPVILV